MLKIADITPLTKKNLHFTHQIFVHYSQSLYPLTGADSINFTVSENTGVISTNALLDRESQDFYTFTITATDSGSRYSLATINVTISDVNDNSPVCGESVYAASVAENVAVAASVISVACSDLDIGSNGEVCHSLPPQFSS